jgi:tetratricopeptide (TPR) repeat protein
VFRYVNLLLQFNRIDEALLIAQTCLKLDPYNGQVIGLVDNLKQFKNARAGVVPPPPPPQNEVAVYENELRNNPSNVPVMMELARIYLQMQQTGRSIQMLDGVLNSPAADANSMIRAAQLAAALSSWPKLETALEKLVKISPDSPEAWFDLAAFKANLRKDNEALPALERALQLSAKRKEKDPNARDLLNDARTDERFSNLRSLPGFQKIVPPK